jgi:hypothetical protein
MEPGNGHGHGNLFGVYGKRYGNFITLRYYLNSTPNSRNLGFDPKQNLLGGLKPYEAVQAP